MGKSSKLVYAQDSQIFTETDIIIVVFVKRHMHLGIRARNNMIFNLICIYIFNICHYVQLKSMIII